MKTLILSATLMAGNLITFQSEASTFMNTYMNDQGMLVHCVFSESEGTGLPVASSESEGTGAPIASSASESEGTGVPFLASSESEGTGLNILGCFQEEL